MRPGGLDEADLLNFNGDFLGGDVTTGDFITSFNTSEHFLGDCISSGILSWRAATLGDFGDKLVLFPTGNGGDGDFKLSYRTMEKFFSGVVDFGGVLQSLGTCSFVCGDIETVPDLLYLLALGVTSQ